MEMNLDMSDASADTFWPALEGLGDRFMQSAKEEPWLMSAAKAIWALPGEARNSGPLGEAFSAMEGWMAAILERGVVLKVVRDDLPLGLLLAMVLGMDEAGDRWIFEHFEELGEAEVERIWKIVFAMWKRMLMPEEA